MWPFTREESPRLFGSNAANAILADAHNINTIAQITPATGWSEPAGTAASLLTSQLPASISPSVWPIPTAHSSAAFPPPDVDPWPLRGNGILSGYRPAAAGGGILGGLTAGNPWPSPGNGILGGLTRAPTGSAPSGHAAGDDDPLWAQMLQDVWSRRMQDDPDPNDSNR